MKSTFQGIISVAAVNSTVCLIALIAVRPTKCLFLLSEHDGARLARVGVCIYAISFMKVVGVTVAVHLQGRADHVIRILSALFGVGAYQEVLRVHVLLRRLGHTGLPQQRVHAAGHVLAGSVRVPSHRLRVRKHV